jgi:hypothetical protein
VWTAATAIEALEITDIVLPGAIGWEPARAPLGASAGGLHAR